MARIGKHKKKPKRSIEEIVKNAKGPGAVEVTCNELIKEADAP